ncbi:MAG: MerR family transcriptional regulator [Actinobacteria bacterium]|nr:MerR family transcriptional regulator [Actinomycetota bacterium]
MKYTVDELARAAKTMTTTVRMYQNKGLLHPPVRQGRIGIYDESHLARIRLIAELQRRGHSLAGIAELIDSHERGEPLTDLLGLSALRRPTPVRIPLVELIERLGGVALSPDDMVRAAKAGLVEVDGSEVVISDRRFLEIGSALVELGVPPTAVLDEWESLSEVMAGVSSRFVGLFEAHLLPHLDSASLAEVGSTVDKLAGLARDVTVTALERALRRDAERFVSDANSRA